MKGGRILLGLMVFFLLGGGTNRVFATDWQTFYDECENGIAGVFYIFNKECNWQRMSCEDYANWRYDWKAWKTGSSYPKWAARDGQHCPDHSMLESVWPSQVVRGTGRATPANEPGSVGSRTPLPQSSPHFRSTEENYQRKLDNAAYVASVKMEPLIDDALFTYINWARGSGNFGAMMQGLKVDANYDEYRDCVLGILAGILTDEQGLKAAQLSPAAYKKFFDMHFVPTLSECGELVQ